LLSILSPFQVYGFLLPGHYYRSVLALLYFFLVHVLIDVADLEYLTVIAGEFVNEVDTLQQHTLLELFALELICSHTISIL